MVLSVRNLCKKYPSFELRDVSFELEPGLIYGFIGRNGAGKSTTLKSLLDFVHPDAGEIEFFGKRLSDDEFAIKNDIGFMSGGVDYYPTKKLSSITAVTARFFDDWDDAAYRRYCSMFALDDSKTPKELSAGMKVKYSLALALSHHPKLLILDEPTSGLDPVSRDELLGVFLDLVRDEGITILFSTHITSDLEHCADNIIHIKNGRIIADDTIKNYVARYRVARFADASDVPQGVATIGLHRGKEDYSALVTAADAEKLAAKVEPADLESIMIHMERE